MMLCTHCANAVLLESLEVGQIGLNWPKIDLFGTKNAYISFKMAITRLILPVELTFVFGSQGHIVNDLWRLTLRGQI